MFSAQQIKNFIPQDAKLNAPRRIDVRLPTFEETITSYNHGFPLPRDVNGGIVYEQTSLAPMNNAASYNSYNAMYPCIPAPSSNRVLNPEPIADSIGFQPAYGFARGPRGIASIKQRDELFDYKCPAIMYTNNQLAPMMKLNPF